LSSVLNSYQEIISNQFGNSFDLIIRDFNFKISNKSVRCKIFYLSSIVDTTEIEETIIKPLQYNNQSIISAFKEIPCNILQIKNYKLLNVSEIDQLSVELVSGNTLLFFEQQNNVISANTSKWKERNVESPEGQRSLKGPNIGFSESMVTNVSLIRKVI
jgi:spore germination protein KA